MKNKRIIITSCIIFFIFCVGLCFYFFSPINSKIQKSIHFEIPYGSGLKSVSLNLQKSHIIRHWTIFYVYGRIVNIQLKAGIYSLAQNMNIKNIAHMLEQGGQEYVQISIPEGLTISKIAILLEKNNVINKADFIQSTKDSQLLKKYNIPAQTLEGYLFPDTYNFNPNMPAEKIIHLFLTNFFKRVDTIKELKNKTPQDLHNTIILASIVEREYRLKEEAPLIASVFLNRLEHNIGLYSCATLEYIVTDIQGKPHPKIITEKEIAIDSPFNTYKWAGLPPSPISNPGLIAINAATNPAKTNYYYFRLTDPQSGKHVFTKDFVTHIEAGKLYTKNASEY